MHVNHTHTHTHHRTQYHFTWHCSKNNITGLVSSLTDDTIASCNIVKNHYLCLTDYVYLQGNKSFNFPLLILASEQEKLNIFYAIAVSTYKICLFLAYEFYYWHLCALHSVCWISVHLYSVLIITMQYVTNTDISVTIIKPPLIPDPRFQLTSDHPLLNYLIAQAQIKRSMS